MNSIKPDVVNEQIILGNMIHNPDFRKRMVTEVSAETFLLDKHQIVFMVFEKLVKKNLDYNEDTFIVESEGAAEQYDLVVYMRELEELIDDNINIDHHVKILVRDKTRKDIATKFIPEFEKILFNDDLTLEDYKHPLDEINRRIDENVDVDNTICSGDGLYASYFNLLKQRRENQFHGLFFKEVDERLTCGLEGGQVSVLAGLSGSGKTTLAANISSRLVHHGVKVLMFPLEEGGLRVFDRMVALKAGVHTRKLKKDVAELTSREKYDIAVAVKQYSQMPLMIFDKPNLNFNMLELMVDKFKPDVIVIDLFEKMMEVRKKLDQENISSNLETFQAFVKERNVHGMITAQIGREQMKKKDKRPTIEYIKNSGKYTEVADLVIGVHRDRYFTPDAEGPDVLEIIVLKQRDGEAPFKCGYEFDGSTSHIDRFIAI